MATRLEFDHVMIGVRDPRAAIGVLTDHGLILGTEGVHRGQGTSNACFYFENGYVELAWISDPSEVPSAEPICLASRLSWWDTGASPFGFSVRPTGPDRAVPLKTWDYSPPFLPTGATPIPVLTPGDRVHEPLAFVSYFPGPPKAFIRPVPLQTRMGVREVTAVAFASCDPQEPSEELRALQALGLATFRSGGARPAVELTLDGGRVGAMRSFEPEVPLVLRW